MGWGSLSGTFLLFLPACARALQIVSGIIIGTIFLHAGQNPQGVNDRISFFAFTLMALLFTSIEALPIFLEERQIYIRETSRGAYRTSSYVIAGTRWLSDLHSLAHGQSGEDLL